MALTLRHAEYNRREIRKTSARGVVTCAETSIVTHRTISPNRSVLRRPPSRPTPETASTPLQARGVTLVELLMVLTLIAIVLTTSGPSLRNLVAATVSRSEASRLLASLRLARARAVALGSPVRICPADPAARRASRCGRDFNEGWLLIADSALSPGSPDAIPLRREAAPARGYSIRRRDGRRPVATSLSYRRDGSTRRGSTFRICLPAGNPVPGWRVVVSASGRARLARDSSPCMS